MDLKNLQKEIPYQWKIQAKSKDGKTGSYVAYIDARDVENLLDEAVGVGNWQDDYKTVGNHLVAGIGIKIENEWIWKYDTGTESDFEKEKGLFSDAFKRAAVKWGIGRFLYDLEIVRLPLNSFGQPLDSSKNVIFNVSRYINDWLKNGKVEKNTTVKVTADAEEPPHHKWICDSCGKGHDGSYRKCLDCYYKKKLTPAKTV